METRVQSKNDGSGGDADEHGKATNQVEIHVYRKGNGPIGVFTDELVGWDQDQLDVRKIADKYGFRSIFAFHPNVGRGVPICSNRVNGRSVLSYRDGSVILIDGEPKDSLIKPITKILLGVVFATFMVTLAAREPPIWLENVRLWTGNVPPWFLACFIVVATRMRSRIKKFLNKKFGHRSDS